MQGNTLRGVVAEKYGSCTKFAKELNWSGRKTRDIVSGRQIPDVKDVKEMARVLDIKEPNEIMRIFFNQ